MKHIIIVIYIISGVFCCIPEINSQTTTWRRTYYTIDPSGSGLECLRDITQTDDGGYIVVGRSRQYVGGPPGYMFAMGIDLYGDSLWFKTYNTLEAGKIIKVNDGNYVIMSIRSGLIKINSTGDTVWTKFRTSNNLGGAQIKYVNNEFYICGQNRNNENPFLMKVDSLGNDVFYKEYSYFEYGFIRDIIFNESDMIMTGEQVYPNMFVMKTDLNGNLIWLENYKLFSYGISMIKVSSNDSVIVGGGGKPLNAMGNSAFLMKFDTSGNLQWHKTYDPGNPFGGSIDFLLNDKNGGVISLGGASESIQNPHEIKARLINFNYDGNEMWRRQYGSEVEHFSPLCFMQTNDSGYIFGGRAGKFITGSHIIKTDKFGNIPVSIQNNNLVLPSDFELNQNYPNPFNPNTIINYQLPASRGESKFNSVSMKVFDAVGKELATLVNENKPAGNYSVTFDGANLPSGVYYCKLTAGQNTSVMRMVLLK